MKLSIASIAALSMASSSSAFVTRVPNHQVAKVTNTGLDSWLSDTVAEVKKKAGEFVEHMDVYEGTIKDELHWTTRKLHPMLQGMYHGT